MKVRLLLLFALLFLGGCATVGTALDITGAVLDVIVEEATPVCDSSTVGVVYDEKTCTKVGVLSYAWIAKSDCNEFSVGKVNSKDETCLKFKDNVYLWTK